MSAPNLTRSVIVHAAVLVLTVLVVLATGCATGDGDTRGDTDAEARTDAEASTGAADPATTSPTTTATGPDEADGVIEYEIEVVATHPHDTGAFTQGLELVDGLLLESTGVRGQSSLRLVEPTTGTPVRLTALDDDLFGEGATAFNGEVWQLTWTSETVIVHGLDDLAERRRIPYRGEGWGLCATDDRLIMSNGSSVLTIRDPVTFEVTDQIEVTDDGTPIGKLNELECVDGVVWANVYQTTRIVAIDPTDGHVVGRADLADLVPPGFEGDRTNVANGIANDPATGRFWLTGKRWPVVYEVELVPVS